MNKVIKISIIAVLSLSVFLVAQAQTESARGDSFSYPIADLGNCGSKTECKNYCADEANFEACSAFAEKHNLLPKEIKNKKDKVKEILKNGGPGGCDSKESCEAYCSGEEHMEECFEFGKKHGLISKEEEEKAGKFLPMMKKGETPGKCQSKTACEAYCHEEGNREECMDFAVKMGAMTREQAERAKKLNGKGPGGCTGREECEAFCNNPANQETCFKFAKENGFIKEDEVRNMKEGMGQMRMGMENAPEEVKECLKENVDEGTLSSMESGEFTPTAGTGESIRECFEKFRPQLEEHRKQEFNASPEVEECLKAAVGEEVLAEVKSGQAPPSRELGEKMRGCFDQQGRREEEQGQRGEEGQYGNGDGQRPPEASGRPMMEGNYPDSNKIKNCLEEKLGSDGMKKFVDPAERNSEEMQSAMRECGYNTRPPEQQNREDGQPENFNKPYPGQKPPQGEYPEPNGEYRKYPPPGSGPEGQKPPEGSYDNLPAGGYPPRPEGGNYPSSGSGSYGQPPEGGSYQPPTGDQPPPPEVKGASTSRLPGFIRWILGR